MGSLLENTRYLVSASAIAFTLAAIAVWIVREVARRYRTAWLYQPKAQRWNAHGNSDGNGIALGGGVGIYAGVLAGLAVGMIAKPPGFFLETAVLATGAIALGLYDDTHGFNPWKKLAIQATLGVATALSIGTIAGFPLPVSVILTVTCVAGFMNAVNMMDNMDGAASGLVTLASAGYILLGWVTGNESLILVCLITGSASLGFWLFNYPPASVFMGDAGSMLLGYLLAVASILSTHGHFGNPLAQWIAPSLIVALFVTDVVLVVLWRLRNGRPVMRGDTHHLTHRMATVYDRSDRKAVLTLYGIQLVLILLALMVAISSVGVTLLIFLASGILLVLFVRLLWNVSTEPDLRTLSSQKRAEGMLETTARRADHVQL